MTELDSGAQGPEDAPTRLGATSADATQPALPTPETKTPAASPAPRRWRWWAATRWTIVVVFLAFCGFLAGTMGSVLMVASSGAGDAVLARPTSGRFAFPLQLKDRVNVLIIGIDQTLDERRRLLTIARSDTMVLATFDPHRRYAGFLSIPRDTRAQIRGRRTEKINAAYAYGGTRMTIAAVEDLVPVRVHYYVKLGADSFARLIDAVGDVTVDVEKDMNYRDSWAGLEIDLKKGRQRLDGHNAMAYARFRHDALGDIGRARRQQQVIQALFARMRDPDTIWRAPQVLEAISRSTETNLRPHEMLALAWFMKNRGGSTAVTTTLPGRFGPIYWEPVPTEIRAMVLDMFYGLKADVAAETSVEVINESGVPGVARLLCERIQALGFRVTRIAAGERVSGKSLFVERRGKPIYAGALRDYLGAGSVVSAAPPSGPNGAEPVADITVYAARDFGHIGQARQETRANSGRVNTP